MVTKAQQAALDKEAAEQEAANQASVDPQAEGKAEGPVDPPLEGGEPAPPLGKTANEAMESLKQGDTSCLADMAPDQLKAVRPMFKDWANGEEARLKSEYARVYNDIINEMNRKGVVY